MLVATLLLQTALGGPKRLVSTRSADMGHCIVINAATYCLASNRELRRDREHSCVIWRFLITCGFGAQSRRIVWKMILHPVCGFSEARSALEPYKKAGGIPRAVREGAHAPGPAAPACAGAAPLVPPRRACAFPPWPRSTCCGLRNDVQASLPRNRAARALPRFKRRPDQPPTPLAAWSGQARRAAGQTGVAGSDVPFYS